jgi:hypothetical protein
MQSMLAPQLHYLELMMISLDVFLRVATLVGFLPLLWSTLCGLGCFVPRSMLECGGRMGMLPFYAVSGTAQYAGGYFIQTIFFLDITGCGISHFSVMQV